MRHPTFLWKKQITTSKEYKWSQRSVQFGIKEGTRRRNEDKTISSIINSVNLNLDEQLIWKNIRSSYRNLIKKNQKYIEIRFPKDFSISNYKKLHHQVSGKITRSNLTWELQKKMFDENKLIICEAFMGNEFIGFSFLLSFNLSIK